MKKVQKTAQMASVGDQESIAKSIYLSHLCVCVRVTAARKQGTRCTVCAYY